MNKHIIITILTLLALGFAGCEREKLTDNGSSAEPINNEETQLAKFSVAEGRQVLFSKGNLQFSTAGSHVTIEGDTAEGTFRFAEHQYDYIGQGNAQVSSTYTGWIDLLCWGSSGWHVSPWSEKDGDYDIESLCGDEAYADWGVYNAIQGDDHAGQWRTLTRDEWDYLINLRPASTVDGIDSARYAEATVAGTAGLIIFPDRFVRPDGLAPIANINSNNFAIAFTDNVYSADEWRLLEQAGAVFLPAAGFRGGTWLSTVGEGGSYWASTCNANRQAYALLFISGLVNASAECTYDKDRGYGRSVRLVKDIR